MPSPEPSVLALGTGRTLRAAAAQVQPIDGKQHALVSLVGNIAPDGAASAYDVLTRLADMTKARYYPVPLPVIAETEQQRDLLVAIEAVQRVHSLAANADSTLVGVGQMDLDAPQYKDGFISRKELLELIRIGAVGEIAGWNFDETGGISRNLVNLRLTSAPLRPSEKPVVGVAVGRSKVTAIQSALRGRLLNSLITDENTAKTLLQNKQDSRFPPRSRRSVR